MELTEGAVARLRDLEAKSEARNHMAGQAAGRGWVLAFTDDRDIDAVEHLVAWSAWLGPDKEVFFSQHEADAWAVCEHLFFEMFPQFHDDIEAAARFWRRVAGEDRPLPSFVRGFVEGALTAYQAYQAAKP